MALALNHTNTSVEHKEIHTYTQEAKTNQTKMRNKQFNKMSILFLNNYLNGYSKSILKNSTRIHDEKEKKNSLNKNHERTLPNP